MSGRGTHRAGGAALGLIVAHAGSVTASWGLREMVVVASVSALCGGGRWSPDIDQYRAWRRLDRWVPDEWLGGGGPLQHRGVSHWWGVIVAQAVGWVFLLSAVPGLRVVWPVAVGQVTGWVSHLLLDYLYGRRVVTPEGLTVVRAGVPLMPWWAHRGGLWTSSGPGSAFAGFVLSVASLGAVAWLVHSGGAS